MTKPPFPLGQVLLYPTTRRTWNVARVLADENVEFFEHESTSLAEPHSLDLLSVRYVRRLFVRQPDPWKGVLVRGSVTPPRDGRPLHARYYEMHEPPVGRCRLYETELSWRYATVEDCAGLERFGALDAGGAIAFHDNVVSGRNLQRFAEPTGSWPKHSGGSSLTPPKDDSMGLEATLEFVEWSPPIVGADLHSELRKLRGINDETDRQLGTLGLALHVRRKLDARPGKRTDGLDGEPLRALLLECTWAAFSYDASWKQRFCREWLAQHEAKQLVGQLAAVLARAGILDLASTGAATFDEELDRDAPASESPRGDGNGWSSHALLQAELAGSLPGMIAERLDALAEVSSPGQEAFIRCCRRVVEELNAMDGTGGFEIDSGVVAAIADGFARAARLRGHADVDIETMLDGREW